MYDNEHVPITPGDLMAEIASILAKGYQRYRKGRHIAADSGSAPDNVAKVTESEAITENELDGSGQQSRCSTAS